MFTVPLGLYNGGTMGVCQLVRTLLTEKLGVPLNFDLAGILNLILNIPLMLLAYKSLSKTFVIRTIFVVAVQTVTVSLVPTGIVLVDDTLTACVIGGALGGIGTGIILRAGGSTAGFDILGVWLAKTKLPFGVGTITAMLNAVIYIICALAFDLQTAIYSLIFAFVTAFVTDKLHTQGINCAITIVTADPAVAQAITQAVSRGVTVWRGEGGHTGDGKYICYMVANKFEGAPCAQGRDRSGPPGLYGGQRERRRQWELRKKTELRLCVGKNLRQVYVGHTYTCLLCFCTISI